jgi:regulator of protease activity HflC (stomatin/prohibitin superfamily)
MARKRPKPELSPRLRRLRRLRRRIWSSTSLLFKMVIIILLFTGAIFADRIIKSVYSGEMGVKWSRFKGGTVLDRSYPEGTHFLWPWDEFFIYDMREQELKLETVVYSEDGLEITISASIRFRPTPGYLPRLHQDLGPKYVDKVVIPGAISSMRKVFGNFTPEMIYSKDEEGLLKELGETLRADLDTKYFQVTEFLVLELRLPTSIEDAIKDKLTEEQQMLSYRFRLERERDEKKRRVIEAEGIRAFEEISRLSILRWRGIEATEHLADSNNAKIILIGTGEGQLPVILNADAGSTSSTPPTPPTPPTTTLAEQGAQ